MAVTTLVKAVLHGPAASNGIMIAYGGALPRGGQPLLRPLPDPGSRRRRHAHHRHGQHRNPRQHI